MHHSSPRPRNPLRVLRLTATFAAGLLVWCGTMAHAAEPGAGGEASKVVGKEELERALAAPKGGSGVRTRGLRVAPRIAPAAAAGDGAASPAGAGGSSASPTAPVPAAATPAADGDGPGSSSIALDIPFELNSSALRPAAAAQLRQLAAALQSESLAPFRFLIAGHTDASGDAGYNRRLSGRRADTVRRRLIDAGVDPKRLDARGFGEDELLDPAEPNAAANRRVEIRNLGAAQP